MTIYAGLYPLDAPTPLAPHAARRSRPYGPGIWVVTDGVPPPPSDHEVRLTLLLLEVALSTPTPLPEPVPDPDGDGTVEPGDNPDPDGSICGEAEPLTWCELAVGADVLRYAKTPINVGDPKDPRAATFGTIRRALSNAFADNRGATMNPTLIDTDGALRALEVDDSLIGSRYTQYVSSKRRLLADPDDRTRVFDGVITDTAPGAPRIFSVQVTDYLSLLLDEFNKKTFPQRVYTLEDFPEMGNDPNDPTNPGNPTWLGKPVPIGYGLLSDEQAAVPEGVVPFTFTQKRPFASLGGFPLYEFIAFGHAAAATQSLFVPTGGGLSTGTPYPSRMPVTAATAGTTAPGEYAFPGSPLWLAEFGTTNYVDYNGRRYYAVYGFGPRAELNRTGQVPLCANLPGIEDVGDGTGALIDDLYRQVLHLLVNWLFQSYQSGPWLAPPTVGSGLELYSRIDTASFEAIKTYMDGLMGGVKGAFLLGYNGTTQTFGQILQLAAQNGQFEYGANRHGQLTATVRNPDQAVNRDITGLADILRETYHAKRRRDLVRNVVTYRYARRYVPSLAGFTPAEDEVLPVQNTKPETDWQVDDQRVSDAASIIKYGERVEDLSFELVRDGSTADYLAQAVLDANAVAPVYVDFQEGPCGIDTDLGDVDRVTHFDGLTDGPRPMRCEEHELDLDQFKTRKVYREV